VVKSFQNHSIVQQNYAYPLTTIKFQALIKFN